MSSKICFPDLLIGTNLLFMIYSNGKFAPLFYELKTEKKESGEEFTLAKSDGHYYGFTWSENELFFSSEKSLYRCDKDINNDIKFKKTKYNNSNDIHQIYYNDEKLLIANTQKNCIDLIDLQNPKKTRTVKWNAYESDTNHVNSFYFYKDHYFVCLHNKNKPSDILVFDKEFNNLKDTIKGIGLQNHNIHIENDMLYTLSSKNSKLVLYDLNSKKNKFIDVIGKAKEVPKICNYLRGFSRIKNGFIIGATANTIREKRDKEVSWIMLFDNDLNHIDSIKLPMSTQLREIRVISEFDYAHNNIRFPFNVKKYTFGNSKLNFHDDFNIQWGKVIE